MQHTVGATMCKCGVYRAISEPAVLERNIYIYIRDYVKKCATTHTCIKSPTTSLGNDFFAVTLNMPTSMVIYMWQS